MDDSKECLNCGKPAVTCSDTVPLCSSCKAQAEGQSRGVKYQNQADQKQQASNPA